MAKEFSTREVISRAITHADTGTTVNAIEIPPKTLIPPFGVTALITEAWAGGTPSWDVGDGDDADSWVDTTEITETTIGAYTGTSTSPYAPTGKYYPTGGTIKVVVAADASDGTGYVVAKFIDLSNFV